MILENVFYPRSIALVGITTSKTHWTRAFLTGLLEFKYAGKLYLVNRKGDDIEGLPVYQNLEDIKDTVDYIIGLVPSHAAPDLIRQAAAKHTKAIHFCTAGFSETGESETETLEKQIIDTARKHNVRIVGPNCLGIYCPDSKVSFSPLFSKESGGVGIISQSGSHLCHLLRDANLRGVRCSKGISYGNACDLNESDYLEYMADDNSTKIIGIYLEGIKDGKRFRKALEKAALSKPIVVLKGGITEGGARAAVGHTSSLAGSATTWNALCKQLNIIQADSPDELTDILVTLNSLREPRGRNVAIVGAGGGASVTMTDRFEKHGFRLPPLPQALKQEIQSYTSLAGTIFRNPIDFGDTSFNREGVMRTMSLIYQWNDIDFLVTFQRAVQTPVLTGRMIPGYYTNMNAQEVRSLKKPVAMVLEQSVLPSEQEGWYDTVKTYADLGIPVYYSFERAALAIDRVMHYYEFRKARVRHQP